jgi:hypothetical protein
VPQDEPRRGRSPAADHVLMGPTDVGGHDLQDDAMGSVPPAERISRSLASSSSGSRWILLRRYLL